MPRHDQPITVALLGTPAVSAATLYGFYDALNSTRRDWQMLHGGPDTPSPFRPLVVSADGRPFDGGNGVRITPDASFEEALTRLLDAGASGLAVVDAGRLVGVVTERDLLRHAAERLGLATR